MTEWSFVRWLKLQEVWAIPKEFHKQESFLTPWVAVPRRRDRSLSHWMFVVASGICLRKQSLALLAFAPCVYTAWMALQSCLKSFLLSFTVVTSRRFRAVACLSLTKLTPLTNCPLLVLSPCCTESVYAVDVGAMAVQWVVSTPNNWSDDDDVLLHSGVNRKSPWRFWFSFGLVIDVCIWCVGCFQLLIILVLFWKCF